MTASQSLRAGGMGAALLFLAGCAPDEPPVRMDPALATPPSAAAPAADADPPTLPSGADALLVRLREREDVDALRGLAPRVRRVSWSRLVLRAADGRRRELRDEVVDGELRTVHLFREHVRPLDAYVVEVVYVPEGGRFLLIDARTGAETEVDSPPVPSPDGRRFVTASMDLIAGHSPNRIRVYRAGPGAPELEWEIEPRGWGAYRPVWSDSGTIELVRGDLDEATQSVRTSSARLRWTRGGWEVDVPR